VVNLTRVEFTSHHDARMFRAVALLAAGLSYWHAREFFAGVMDPVSASVTPLLLDLIVYWLADAYVTQTRAGRPLGLLRAGSYGLMAASVGFNVAGADSLGGAAGRALAPSLFAFFVLVRVRLALGEHRAEGDRQHLPGRLWLRHPVRTGAAWLWLARQSAPAFEAARAERDRHRDARAAVRLVLPGRSHRAARATVLRQLSTGRLTAAEAVAASGLLSRPGVPELHRVALVASLGGPPKLFQPTPGTLPVAPAEPASAELEPAGPPAPPQRATSSKQTPGVGTVRRPSPRRSRGELEQAGAAFLAEHPDASARALAVGIGCRWETARDLLAGLRAPGTDAGIKEENQAA
jgi:hypothetical protein